MMKNRAEKLVIKAFLELETPKVLLLQNAALAQRFGADLRALANRLLMSREERIVVSGPHILNREDKVLLNEIVTRQPDGAEKWEMIFFYRLAILVEIILLKYRA